MYLILNYNKRLELSRGVTFQKPNYAPNLCSFSERPFAWIKKWNFLLDFLISWQEHPRRLIFPKSFYQFQRMSHLVNQLDNHVNIFCLNSNFPGLLHFYWLSAKSSMILIDGWKISGHMVTRLKLIYLIMKINFN